MGEPNRAFDGVFTMFRRRLLIRQRNVAQEHVIILKKNAVPEEMNEYGMGLCIKIRGNFPVITKLNRIVTLLEKIQAPELHPVSKADIEGCPGRSGNGQKGMIVECPRRFALFPKEFTERGIVPEKMNPGPP